MLRLSLEYLQKVPALRPRLRLNNGTLMQPLPETPKTVIVLPTYNESTNLPIILRDIFSQPVSDLHVLVVDDDSPDGTGQLAESLKKQYPNLHIMHRKTKGGLGKAYVAGFEGALDMGADLIFEMDADLSHDPKYIPHMIRSAADHDLVLGSRYVSGGGIENWNIFRRLISRFGNIYARIVLRMPYLDLTGGYKCYRRHAIESIELRRLSSVGYNFQIETTYRAHLAGMSITEVPIIFTERQHGSSKFDGRIIIEAFLKVLLLPWKR